MYTSVDAFLTEWKYESEVTLKLFKNLTQDKLDVKIHPKVRSLGFLAWHLIHTMQEMMSKTGLKIDIREQQNYNGESVSELCELYEKGASMVAEQVKSNWKDADLKIEDNMYGQMWSRSVTLGILVKHQSHHRGEMLVVMRMLDLPVIGCYGPTQEEWKQYGMPELA